MANLETTWMGIKLKNPLVVSSSGLTGNIDKIENIYKAGAGAIVLKSLFEEQILHESGKLIYNDHSNYPEAADYLENYVKNNSVDKYLQLIENAKKKVSIPVIASINCVSDSDWISFAKKIETSGADGIEININIIPTEADKNAEYYENEYFKIAEQLKSNINIPFSIKIGANFTNLLYIVNQLKFRKVNSVTLFNKFYHPDINLNKMEFSAAGIFSSENDFPSTLRWIGIISDKVEGIDIAASTGIHGAENAIKALLAGATVTQICSVLYQKGINHISNILKDMNNWMSKNNFKDINSIKGKMNYGNVGNPKVYERSQFMKYYSSFEE
ncbi:MAG: dihydroorotate dehydrogenase-like protein [Marinilabiliales bacterium]